ncbi:hypothetical protein D3C87_1765000 [compost metagenome]
MQEVVSDYIFHQQLTFCQCFTLYFICRFFPLIFLQLIPLVPGKGSVSIFLTGNFVTPGFESTLSEFHDITFVYQCYRWQVMFQCIINCSTYQAL